MLHVLTAVTVNTMYQLFIVLAVHTEPTVGAFPLKQTLRALLPSQATPIGPLFRIGCASLRLSKYDNIQCALT